MKTPCCVLNQSSLVALMMSVFSSCLEVKPKFQFPIFVGLLSWVTESQLKPSTRCPWFPEEGRFWQSKDWIKYPREERESWKKEEGSSSLGDPDIGPKRGIFCFQCSCHIFLVRVFQFFFGIMLNGIWDLSSLSLIKKDESSLSLSHAFWLGCWSGFGEGGGGWHILINILKRVLKME